MPGLVIGWRCGAMFAERGVVADVLEEPVTGQGIAAGGLGGEHRREIAAGKR